LAGLPGAASPLEAASCALPGYFAPVVIDNIAYVDGGVYSPTNAVLLSRQDLQMVVIVSPMSGARSAPEDATGAAHRNAACDCVLKARRPSGTSRI
jgi:NTE family protein